MTEFTMFAALLLAIGTGVYTMERHKQSFQEFEFGDILKGKPTALLYLLNATSTAWCLIDIVLRVTSMSKNGLANDTLPLVHILWHTGSALISVVLHYTTHILLLFLERNRT